MHHYLERCMCIYTYKQSPMGHEFSSTCSSPFFVANTPLPCKHAFTLPMANQLFMCCQTLENEQSQLPFSAISLVSNISCLQAASSPQLYEAAPCPAAGHAGQVRPSVCLSICPSVCPSVFPQRDKISPQVRRFWGLTCA